MVIYFAFEFLALYVYFSSPTFFYATWDLKVWPVWLNELHFGGQWNHKSERTARLHHEEHHSALILIAGRFCVQEFRGTPRYTHEWVLV